MTVNNSANKVIAAGNGVQTVFNFSFIAVAAGDITVILTDSSGNQTTLLGSAYSLALTPAAPGQIWSVGGSVTYPLVGSPIPIGSTLTIERQLSLMQLVSLSNQGNIFPSAVETALDLLEMQLQQISELFQRAIVAPVVDPLAPLPLPPAAQRANQGMGFDASGNPVAITVPASGVISSAMQPVVDAATLALGRTALGLGTMATEGIGAGLADDGSGAAEVLFAIQEVSTNQSIVKASHTNVYMCGLALIFTLARANTLFKGFCFKAYALGGNLVLTPDANDNFYGLASGASYIVPQGCVVLVTTDAVASGIWYVELVPLAVPPPGGYLTPLSLTPVILNDVTSGTLYYTPDQSGVVPISNGGLAQSVPFTELSASLASGYSAASAYDWFVTLIAGVPTLVSGPAWRNAGQSITGASNATPIVITANGHNLVTGDEDIVSSVQGNPAANGKWTVTRIDANNFSLNGSVGNGGYMAGTGQHAARGIGTGTTQLARVGNGGFRTNAQPMTARNGASTFTVAANQGTYIGSTLIDASGNTVTCQRSWGSSRIWSIFNAYNRKPIYLKGGINGTWSYNGNGWRVADANVAAALFVFCGLADDFLDLATTGFVGASTISSQSTGGGIGIGFNSLVSPFGKIGQFTFTNSTASGIAINDALTASYKAPPALGLQTISALENGFGVTTAGWTAGEAYMELSALWRG